MARRKKYADALLPALFDQIEDARFGGTNPLFLPLIAQDQADAADVEQPTDPDALDALPDQADSCPRCGRPCTLTVCDDCLDRRARP